MIYSEQELNNVRQRFLKSLHEYEIEAYGTDFVKDIHDMHTKFGVRDVVETFDNEKLLKFLEFRLNFLQEELNEAKAAFETLTRAQENVEDFAVSKVVKAADDIVDAMVDLCVVAVGTLDAFQVNTDVAWTRVHEKNMQKEPGIKPNRPNPLGLPDLIKPEGWTSPEHSDNIGILRKLSQ